MNIGRGTPVLVPIALLALLAAAGSTGSSVLQRDVATMLVYVVAVVGLYVFVGNSGVLSFGHTAFLLIGAYTAAVVSIPAQMKRVLLPDLPSVLADVELPFVAAALVAGVAAALVAALVGAALMRLSGLAAGIATFAVLLIVYVVANNWDAVTRGRGTMTGVPPDTTIGRALLVACLAIVVAYAFQRSRVGLELRAARENEPAARAVGVGVPRVRWLAFVLSAFLVGVAGCLYARLLGSFTPDAFYLNATFLIIAMLVIGGIGSLAGAVIGTVTVSALSVGLRHVEQGLSLGFVELPARPGTQELVLAFAMLVILVFRPRGIMGDRELQRGG